MGYKVPLSSEAEEFIQWAMRHLPHHPYFKKPHEKPIALHKCREALRHLLQGGIESSEEAFFLARLFALEDPITRKAARRRKTLPTQFTTEVVLLREAVGQLPSSRTSHGGYVSGW